MHKKKSFILYVLFSTTLVSCSYYRYHESLTQETQQQATQNQGMSLAEAPDFKAIKSIKSRKKAFFFYLIPGVQFENARTQKERQFLLESKQDIESQELSNAQITQLSQLAKRYREPVSENEFNPEWLQRMLVKVDQIPQALVLTQAANESAWGTSRFARQANNYFGQWCYRKGCGVVPLLRGEGMTHEVAKFKSVQQSIHRYFININSNSAYTTLRAIRAQLRETDHRINTTSSALTLAEGLGQYSERGLAYVKSLKLMMKHNRRYWNEPDVQ